jgi:hypothetical protein
MSLGRSRSSTQSEVGAVIEGDRARLDDVGQ